MDVLDVLRGDGAVNRPTSYEPVSTASPLVRGGAASLTELPASRGETLLVLQWDACGHGLALSSLASEFSLEELVRIAESVPEVCE